MIQAKVAELILAGTLLCACGGEPMPSDFILDPVVQSALRDLASRSDPDPTIGSSKCTADASNWSNEGIVRAYDDIVRNGGGGAAAIAGSWNADECYTTYSNTFPTLTPCAGTITWTNQSGGHITQVNSGELSMGEGDVGFIGQFDGRQLIAQTNHAVGAGCEVDLVNLIILRPTGDPTLVWAETAINVVLDSTCSLPTWQCSVAHLRR